MPLRWEATGTTGELFPVLDADLTLTGDGGDQTRIRLDGSYRPPFGRTGEALDRAVLGRLAAGTIESLVESVADAVADPARGRSPTKSRPPGVAGVRRGRILTEIRGPQQVRSGEERLGTSRVWGEDLSPCPDNHLTWCDPRYFS